MFDGMRIHHLLARGGMSEVYAATRLRDRAALAVKLPRRGATGGAARRLRREIDLLAPLRHPGLVRFETAGAIDGVPYLALARLSGPPLSHLRRPLTPLQVACLGIAVAGTLQYLHDAGVVHRDVTPANILLDRARPVLIDLGLARPRARSDQTGRGEVPGTRGFIPPEAWRSGAACRAPADPRIDVFGLGVTLALLLGGRARPLHAWWHRLAGGHGARLPRLRGGAAALAGAVRRATRCNPRHRTPTAAQLAVELADPIDALGGGPRGCGQCRLL